MLREVGVREAIYTIHDHNLATTNFETVFRKRDNAVPASFLFKKYFYNFELMKTLNVYSYINLGVVFPKKDGLILAFSYL